LAAHDVSLCFHGGDSLSRLSYGAIAEFW
jgi:hypothetical protein